MQRSQMKMPITDCSIPLFVLLIKLNCELAATMEFFSCQKKSGEDEISDTLKRLGGDAEIWLWVEMSEGMCGHADNLYMLKKKSSQRDKYYHKLKKKVQECPWQPKRQEMFIHIWVYVFKKE